MTDLPKVIEQRMRLTDAAEKHPDSSSLTAFVERALPPRMRVDVIDHLSTCSACRLVVALANSSASRDEAPSQVVYGWRPSRWGVLQWASGVAAAAVVAGSLFVVRTNWVAQRPASGNVITATSTTPASATTQPASQVADAPATMAEVRAPRSSNSGKTRQQPTPDDRSMLETGTNVEQMMQVGRRLNPETAVPIVPVTPNDLPASPANSAVLWRIAGPGLVYESFDGGHRWQSVMIHDNLVFRCVTSIGSTVWAGGDAGALYKSDDNGQHWSAVSLFGDAQALPTDNIVTVEFTDLEHGKVTTGLGREMVTSDGGQTWRAQ